jgi:hypothetical protein
MKVKARLSKEFLARSHSVVRWVAGRPFNQYWKELDIDNDTFKALKETLIKGTDEAVLEVKEIVKKKPKKEVENG